MRKKMKPNVFRPHLRAIPRHGMSDVVSGSIQRDMMDTYLKQISSIGIADAPGDLAFQQGWMSDVAPQALNMATGPGCFNLSWPIILAFGAGLGVGYYLLGKRIG
jgi:hypothetical protein